MKTVRFYRGDISMGWRKLSRDVILEINSWLESCNTHTARINECVYSSGDIKKIIYREL